MSAQAAFTGPAEVRPPPKRSPVLHHPDSQVLHDFEPSVTFDLEPVNSVTVTTVIDNVTDIFMPDQGRPTVRRPAPGAAARPPSWRAAWPRTRCWPSTGSRCS